MCLAISLALCNYVYLLTDILISLFHWQLFCQRSTDEDEAEPIEMEFVQRNRRQSLIGSTVQESDGKTRRMSLIGATIGTESTDKLPIVEQSIEEEE